MVLRVPRNFGDRVVGLFVPLRRYGCASALCGWEGLLRKAEPDRRAAPYRGQRVLDAASASCSPPGVRPAATP